MSTFDSLADTISKVNLIDISTLELLRLVRSVKLTNGQCAFGLAQSHMVALALKEAHRVGVIRGNALKK